MQVLKFGGTSVGSAENIEKVVEIIRNQQKTEKTAVVVSAMAGVTNNLYQAANQSINDLDNAKQVLKKLLEKHLAVINYFFTDKKGEILKNEVQDIISELKELVLGVNLLKELSPKVLDKIVVKGEILSSTIICEILKQQTQQLIYLDAREYIVCNHQNGTVHVNFVETYRRIEKIKAKSFSVALIPGFIASDKNGEIASLGRGGSDYTASIFATGLKAEKLIIWTDVDGVFSADPRQVKLAYPIKELSYQEAMELSHFGAKVIYPPTLHPVFSSKIDLYVKNTFNPESHGTLISQRTTSNGKLIKGLSSIDNISLVTLTGSGMVGISGFSARFFNALSVENINVILISQASSEHSICIAIKEEDSEIALESLKNEFAYEMSVLKVDMPIIEKNYSIVAVVGERMNKTIGISGKSFSVLGRNGINIHAIAQGGSELNISFVIANKNVKKALNVLHEEFFLSEKKRINLYVAGAGNVGAKLLELIVKQKDYLHEEKNLEIKVKGLINSKKMIITEDDDFLESHEDEIQSGVDANIDTFLAAVKNNNLRGSIFVDNTASEEISSKYEDFLKANISVVTCNKIAASSGMENYKSLKKIARENRTEFLYESNVGAGLPLVKTINNLKATGDNVLKIDAVLSGSLNFIFNEFYKGCSFKEAVEMAMKAGYTEPDPRIDLSGTDIARKILILARESGYEMDLDDIKIISFLPESIFSVKNVEEFLEKLDDHKEYLSQLLENAQKNELRLRIISTFEKNKAVIELKQVDSNSPFYHVEGKDNVVVLTTVWYNEQPLIIKGAGAGAEVTASGILSDIISIANM